MEEHRRLSLQELEAGLEGICAAPKDAGPLELIVRRAGAGLREVLEKGELDAAEGLVGDSWKARGSSRTPDRAADPDSQLTVMNARVAALLAGAKSRWQLSGDQLFLDLDLSAVNLPPGTRLALGAAVLEITASPHTGCKKFADWFGPAAVTFINSPAGKALRLRGLHARVVKSGAVKLGDIARTL